MSTANYRHLGSRVRSKRKKLHMTQLSLAESTGLSVPYISLVENGQKKPSLDAILKISEVLDLSLDYLLLGEHYHHVNMSNLLSDYSSDERRLLLDFLQAMMELLEESENKASE